MAFFSILSDTCDALSWCVGAAAWGVEAWDYHSRGEKEWWILLQEGMDGTEYWDGIQAMTSPDDNVTDADADAGGEGDALSWCVGAAAWGVEAWNYHSQGEKKWWTLLQEGMATEYWDGIQAMASGDVAWPWEVDSGDAAFEETLSDLVSVKSVQFSAGESGAGVSEDGESAAESDLVSVKSVQFSAGESGAGVSEDGESAAESEASESEATESEAGVSEDGESEAGESAGNTAASAGESVHLRDVLTEVTGLYHDCVDTWDATSDLPRWKDDSEQWDPDAIQASAKLAIELIDAFGDTFDVLDDWWGQYSSLPSLPSFATPGGYGGN